MTDWKAIKAEYIRGGTSYRKLAVKHGVSFSTLRGFAEREKWTDLKAQTQHKTDTKLVEITGGREASRSAKLIDVADKLLDKISETIDAMDVVTSQSLKNFTSALKDLKDIKGYKSEIDLKEQEARIAKLIKESQAEEKEDNEIKVTIECGLDEYSK